MAEWIDMSEKWPGSVPGANYLAESVGPWQAVRVCRAHVDADGAWKIWGMRGGLWRQVGGVFPSKEVAMRVAEVAAEDPATRFLVATAERLDAAAAEAWRIAGEAASKAAGRAGVVLHEEPAGPGWMSWLGRAAGVQ